MPKPLVPLVVVRGGQPWVLNATFSRSVAYRRHRTSLERIEGYVEMLEYLEQLVVRLRRAATIDRTVAATQEEWLHRSDGEDAGLLRAGVCRARPPERRRFRRALSQHHDAVRERRAPETSTRHTCITRYRGPVVSPERRAHVVHNGSHPSAPAVHAIRSDLLREVREIWRVFDVSERRAALLKHIAVRGWTISSSSVPFTVGMRPPTRVTDLVLSQHTGIGQKRLRRARIPAIAELIYQ